LLDLCCQNGNVQSLHNPLNRAGDGSVYLTVCRISLIVTTHTHAAPLAISGAWRGLLADEQPDGGDRHPSRPTVRDLEGWMLEYNFL
jgi:hypothetical protein